MSYVMRFLTSVVCSIVLTAGLLRAEGPMGVEKANGPTKVATLSDFDYLLGDWEFTAQSKQWGSFQGLWSAVKLAEGQILDEYRVIGDDGETYYVTTTLRNLNEALDVWDLVGADEGGGLRDFGTARRLGDEMHIQQTFGASTDAPSLWWIRYHSITADRFLWVADRSTDGGKTWVRDFQKESYSVVPGSATGQLRGLRGEGSSAVGHGTEHSFTLEYEFEQSR